MSELRASAVWNECLGVVRERLSRKAFHTWFEPIEPIAVEEGENGVQILRVRLPSRFYYEWLEEHYFRLVRRAVHQVLGPKGRLLYVVVQGEDAERPALTIPTPPDGTSQSESSSRTGSASKPGSSERETERDAADTEPYRAVGDRLHPRCTFDRFIEGAGNRLARSGARAVARDPGSDSYNPFLVYGGVGLGKTHLIQAIGNAVQEGGKDRRVLYISSERFTTEFVQAIRNNRASEFSRSYRQVDVLIVDDVQYLGGREKTQEEFFHIFNTLHQAGSQIVVSADRPPSEIDEMEERLRSRFQWGLSCDLQPPGLETRMAILRRRAEEDGIDLSSEVIEFIARTVTSNIRELEGALIRLLAHAALEDRPVDRSMARQVLTDLREESSMVLDIPKIQEVVCGHFGISIERVRGRTRKREVVQARQVAMYFAKEYTNHSLKTIGVHFGGRDHSTVIHSNRSVADRITTESTFEEEVERVRRKLERIDQS